MDLDEVREVTESDCGRMVLDALAKAIRQPRVTPVGHAKAQVLPLNKTG
jgi:hypothetical protein